MNPLLPTGPETDPALLGPMDEGQAPHSAFRADRLLRLARRFWWIPLATFLLSLAGAISYVLQRPPTYVSRASMWETVKLRLPDGALFAEDMQNFLGTQSQLLQSETLRQLALQRLRGSTNSNAIPMDDDGEPMEVAIRVSQNSKSSVFVLEASSADPGYTRSYLDALMAVYLEYKRNIRKVVSGDTLASISEQVERTERDLKAEQDRLIAFQQTNNLAILEEEAKIAAAYLAKLKTELSDLRMEGRLIESAAAEKGVTLATLTNLPAATNLDTPAAVSEPVPTPPALNPAEQQAAFEELERLRAQREGLSRYLRADSPRVVELDESIARAERQAGDRLRQHSTEQLATSLQSIQFKMDNILATIREWESKVIEANLRMAEAERLKLNLDRIQTVYERLVMLVQSVGISRNIDQETLSILQPASAAEQTRKQEVSAVAAAGVGGLGLGVGILLLIALRDDRLVTGFDVGEKLGEMVIGQVPALRGLKRDALIPLVEASDERHAYAESYRNLRSALLFMAVNGERPKVLLVTSAMPDEGKSTVAANLARMLAFGGARVLLVDGDLRKGHLDLLMELKPAPGVAELLSGRSTLESAVQTNSLPNLGFLARGHAQRHTGDLYVGSSVDELLARMRERYDHVIIDSSPIFASDDVTTFAPKADATLFVVRSDFSRVRPVREALGLLYQRQARVVGVVLNRADSTDHSYYYYKYDQYYGNGKAGAA